jgi:HAD superfamily hydrolase (TIGR01509 family)
MSCLLIFDFDGVIADSEVLANQTLAEIVTELGVPTTLSDAYDRYMGKRLPEVIEAIEGSIGRQLPADFPDFFQSRTLNKFREELQAVSGVYEYLRAFEHIPRCIASSSSQDRLWLCLDLLNLRDAFAPHVYSASLVPRGKPHPDILLHAAAKVGVAPSKSIVIEDSVGGVQAGVAAGMTVIGLLAASHTQDGHQGKLFQAGAHFVATSFAEAEAITHGIIADLERS